MTRSIPIVFMAACIAALALAPLAAPALPRKGVVYAGTLYADGLAAITKKVELRASTAKRVRAKVWCGTGRPLNTIQMKVQPNGRFRGHSNVGSLTVWSITGRFVSPTTAKAVLRLNATCDGKGGPLTLKTA
jgi:hypothetical protein